VPWGRLALAPNAPAANTANDNAPDSSSVSAPPANLNPANAPEWLRRMLCCLAYEVEKANPQEPATVETKTDEDAPNGAPTMPTKSIVLALST
jgi:hypothetical protein